MQDPRDEEHKTREIGQCSHMGAQGTRRQLYHIHRGPVFKALRGIRGIRVSRLTRELGLLHVGQRQAHIFG